MSHDFKYDGNSGVFTSDESDDTLLSDIVLILSIKSVSRQKTGGYPVYSGDWFVAPSIGIKTFEIKTTSSDDVLLIKKELEASLSLLIKNGKASSVTVTVTSSDVAGRFDATVNAIGKNGIPVLYKQFIEVF